MASIMEQGHGHLMPDDKQFAEPDNIAMAMRKVTLRRSPRMWTLLIAVALLGGVASVLRVLVISFFQRSAEGAFPWGTLVVNAVGCFVFGLIWTMFDKRVTWDPQVKFVILAGFAGAFTTYSTFAFETWYMVEKSQLGLAGVNFVAQSVVGFALLFGGVIFGRWVT